MDLNLFEHFLKDTSLWNDVKSVVVPLPTSKPPAINTLLLKLESPTACNLLKILLEYI